MLFMPVPAQTGRWVQPGLKGRRETRELPEPQVCRGQRGLSALTVLREQQALRAVPELPALTGLPVQAVRMALMVLPAPQAQTGWMAWRAQQVLLAQAGWMVCPEPLELMVLQALQDPVVLTVQTD